MSQREIDREMEIIYTTRLGILCENRVPTVAQMKMAQDEADEWRFKFNAQARRDKGFLI